MVDKRDLLHLLDEVASGSLSPEEAEKQLATPATVDLGFAKVDTQRGLRQGVSEVIFGEGKTAEEISAICLSMLQSGQSLVLITRLSQEKADKVAQSVPLDYHQRARMGLVGSMPKADGDGIVVVAAAGTSDLPIAEEAALTAEALGCSTYRLFDVGVAGIHRLFAHKEELEHAQVIVAVAGMEGALPSVIAGLVSCPVIAVPTSVGYGTAFHGLTALLAMLNSCASGVSVVNIDNGFGAGYQAALIDHIAQKGALHDNAQA
jgi:NCAIR mutase (PurE)-related protein